VNSLLNDRDDDLEDHRAPRDREITLGTTVVLGIFFALAVICAVFFGFGYSVGAKHNVQTTLAAGAVPDISATFSSFKPPSGSPASGSATTPRQRPPETVTVPNTPPPAPAPIAHPIEKAPAEVAVTEPAPKPTPKPAQAPPPQAPAPVSASAAGQIMVQIAAVSHQEDADLLVSSLKRRNYNVGIHQEPQDKLLHVQVGPFANKKDADAMRQRLQADGFNAIVKDAGH
jgi:DedD protein